jgi:hypothetical protein
MNGYYTEEEFVRVLHARLITGLNFLFISVGTTIVAFIAALYLFLEGRVKLFTIGVSIPFISCVILMLPSSVFLITLRLIIPEKELVVWN